MGAVAEFLEYSKWLPCASEFRAKARCLKISSIDHVQLSSNEGLQMVLKSA